MAQRVTNYTIQFLACFFVVVMLFSWKESFMTFTVRIQAHDNSGEQNQADQGHLEEHGEDVEPLHLNQQVGETYEENFIRNAEQLGAKR